MTTHEEKLISILQRIINIAVQMLAVLMTFVIFWGVGDVVYALYQRLLEPPFMLLDITQILATFGSFLAVLIAIEIFANITLYLTEKKINVKLVLATAIMAIARKVIIFDYDHLEPAYIYATAAVIISLSVTWFVTVRHETDIIRLDHGAKKI